MINKLENNNSDIDFGEVLNVLWKGKWKIIIITIIFFLLAFTYSISLPKIYKTSLTVYQSERSVFTKYFLLNEVLNDHFNLYGAKNKKAITFNYIPITPSNIFNMVRNEFNNSNEIRSMLENLSRDNDKFKNFTNTDIRNLSNSFIFFPIANNNDNFSKLNFNWNNLEEGQFIIDTTIKGVLNNVRNVLINNIDGLAQTIEYKNQNKINSLKTKIELLEKLNKENDQKKLKYLTEHLKIAKKLNIKDIFDGDFKEFTSLAEKLYQDGQLKNNIPYFAFGYDAIQLEINQILKRSNNENAYFALAEYRILLEKLTDIQSDMTAQTLIDTIDILKNDDLTNWIKYDLSDASAKLMHNIKLYCVIGIILGLIFGVSFVMFAHHFKRTKK